MLTMRNKIESYSVRDFLAGAHRKQKTSHTTLYGLAGINITPHGMFSPSNFNAPYMVIFGVAGVILLSTLIEYTLNATGNERYAEMVSGFTGMAMPICFYIFLLIGIFKIL